MSKKHKNLEVQKEEGKSIWQFKIAEYFLYFLTFATPLYFSTKHFYAFNSPKILFVLAVVTLSFVFYLLGRWKSEEFKIKVSLLNIAVVLFGLILTISSILGIDPINSFFGWGNVVPLVAIYALVVYAFILGFLIKRDKNIVYKIILSSFLAGVFSVLFFYTGLPSPVGKTEGSTLGNSSYLGGFLVFITSFGFVLFLYTKKVWQKILLALMVLFVTINPLFINKEFLLGNINLKDAINNPISMMGIANGGAMGIALSIIFIVILFFVFSRKKIFKIIGLVAMLSLLLGVVFISRGLATEGSKINKIFTEEKSGNRFVAWNIAKEGYADKPLLGNGYNNYVYNFDKYYNSDLYKKGYAVERLLLPHNVVWEFASNTGALGLFGYLFLLIVTFITLLYVRKINNISIKEKYLRIILAGTLFGYFLQNLFVFDTINTYLPLFTIVGIGLGLGEGYLISLGKTFRNYKNINKILIIIGIIFSVYVLNNLCLRGSIESKGMNFTSETKNMVEFAKKREGLDERSPFGGIMEYTFQSEKLFKLYQKIMDRVDDRNKSIFLYEIKSLVRNLESVVEKQPRYSGSYLVMSELLNLHLLIDAKDGEYIKIDKNKYDKNIWDKSYRYIEKARELNGNNPQNYLVLSQLYMLKGDFESAYKYSKDYIEEAPEYAEGYRFAKSLLKIKPDKNFEEYVNQMEQKNLK